MWAERTKKEEKIASQDFMREVGKIFVFINGNRINNIALSYDPESEINRLDDLIAKEPVIKK